MKRNLTPVALWCMFMLFSTVIKAQTATLAEPKSSPYFSIAAGAVNLNPSAKTSILSTTSYRNMVVPGANYEIQITYNSSYEIEHSFTSNWGGYIEGNVHFPVGERWTLRTGIVAQYDQFKYKSEIGSFNFGEPVDTFLVPIINVSPATYKFIDEPGYNPDAPESTNYDILQMRVPLSLQYHTPLNFSFEAGIYVQSLLWSQSSRYATTERIERETLSDGSLQYTIFRNTSLEKQRPIPNLNNATAGWQLGLSYRLNRAAVEASYGKTFLNPFVKDNNSTILYNGSYNAKVTYTYMRVGVRYFL